MKILKRKITKREWIFFAVSLSICVIFLGQKSLQKAYSSISNLNDEITLNEKKLFILKSLSSRAVELNTEYNSLFSGNIGAQDSDAILQEIGSIAKSANANIINIKPNLAKDAKDYQVYAVKIESQDDVATLAKFLSKLTAEQKNIGVERIQVKAQGKEESPKISLTLNAVVFKD